LNIYVKFKDDLCEPVLEPLDLKVNLNLQLNCVGEVTNIKNHPSYPNYISVFKHTETGGFHTIDNIQNMITFDSPIPDTCGIESIKIYTDEADTTEYGTSSVAAGNYKVGIPLDYPTNQLTKLYIIAKFAGTDTVAKVIVELNLCSAKTIPTPGQWDIVDTKQTDDVFTVARS